MTADPMFDKILKQRENEDNLRALKLAKEAGGLTDEGELLLKDYTGEPDPVFRMDLEPDNIIQMYYDWGSQTQDAYPEYHALGIMVLLSHIAPAKMCPQYGDIRANLWTIILGPSGTSGKSTALKGLQGLTIVPDMLDRIFRMQDKPTPESFAEGMAEHPRSIMMVDEAVGLLKFMKKDYAADLPEDMIKSYDCTSFSKRRTKKKNEDGSVVVTNPELSAIWNTTPESFGKHATLDKFENGFFLRPIYLVPLRPKPLKRDAANSPEARRLKADIINRLKDLHNDMRGLTLIFEESEVLNDWKHQRRVEMSSIKSDMKRSAMTRSYDHARKIAMILTMASEPFAAWIHDQRIDFKTPSNRGVCPADLSYKIPAWAAQKAIEWTDTVFVPYFDRAYRLTFSNAGTLGKVMRRLETGEPVSRLELADITHKHGRQFDEIMEEFDVFSFTKTTPGAKRPTTFYKLNA